MAKYKNEAGNYCQVWRKGIKILNEHRVTYSARWLYIHLHELEHAFTNPKKESSDDFFYRSIAKLQEDTGIGHNQITKGIKILKELGLIQNWKSSLINDTGKKTEYHVNYFRILEP